MATLLVAGSTGTAFAADGAAAPGTGGSAPTLFVIGKTVNYRQSMQGSLTRLNYHFFAEIFLPDGAMAGSGRLIDPHGHATAFEAQGSVLGISGQGDFASLATLNARAPDGTYVVRYEPLAQAPIQANLELRGAERLLADPARITLQQDGRPVGAAGVSVEKPLVIEWSPFHQGHSDPNGISDDLIFVHVGDCHGNIITRTPAPFTHLPALTYRTGSYVVPAHMLQAGATYQVSIEHAPLVTSRVDGIPAFVTYPATTFLDFRTAGTDSGSCPALPARMDPGQSDRAIAGNRLGDPTAVAERAGEEVRFFVVVKSSNYAQDAGGALKLLNYHFFSEAFASPGALVTGQLQVPAGPASKLYEQRNGTLYVEGGHFTSLADLDRAYPNGRYRVSLRGSRTNVQDASLNLSGPAGRTDIPPPIRISIEQGDRTVAPTQIDTSRPTTIRWTAFSNGRPDPHGIVDDMIFVVVQDCRGQRVFHTGLPFDGPYLRYDATQVQLPAHLLQPGEPYSMFVEMPHVADSIRSGNVPGFASYATATYLDLRTTGNSTRTCPPVPPAMDTGQTDRPDVYRSPDGGAPAIKDQVTFLYYEDLAPPRHFYREVLGLEPYFEQEWVSLYHTTPGASIGLVKVQRSDSNPASRRAAIMVSLVTDDVDGWYARLKGRTDVHIVKLPYDHPAAPIRALELEDPAGYPVEFFQWRTAAGATRP